MRVQPKLANFCVILFISLFVLFIMPTLAVADEERPGELRINTDRILQDQNETTELRETELERIFPTLFTEETKEIMEEKELEQERKMEELEKSIFSEELEGSTVVQEAKDALFREEYTAVEYSGNQTGEDSSLGSGSSNVLLAVFAGMGLLLFAGLYTFMRDKLD